MWGSVAVTWLVSCWSFTSWQHLRSYQDARLCNIYTIGWLLEFYVLATSEVISEWLATCDSAHSLWAIKPTSTMTWYAPQSHNPDTIWLIVGVLCPDNIYGHIRMGIYLCQYTFMEIPQWEARPQASDLIQHSVTCQDIGIECCILIMSITWLGSDKYQGSTTCPDMTLDVVPGHKI